jgi:hypothetical protein
MDKGDLVPDASYHSNITSEVETRNQGFTVSGGISAGRRTFLESKDQSITATVALE